VNQNPGTPVTVTVNTDKDSITTKLQAMVDAYNGLMSYIHDQQQKGATLQGNSVLRSVQSQVSSLASGPLAGSRTYSMFAQVGITQIEGGQLAFDKTKFSDALTADYGAVRDLFVQRGTSNGKAYQITQALAALTNAKTGVFKLANDSIDSKVKQIDANIERYTTSAEAYKAVLEKQFAAMEKALASLKAQGDYLTNQFATKTKS
jgi:flagellar hook-associated protein 2